MERADRRPILHHLVSMLDAPTSLIVTANLASHHISAPGR